MAHTISSSSSGSSRDSRLRNADTASSSNARTLLSLLAISLFTVCSPSARAQFQFPYIPPVVVSSVSPVPVPTPPLPTGSSLYGTQQGDLTPVYSPTSLALDACGNIYTLDKGSDTGTAPGNTGDTVTEIPVNGGYASIVENVGGYENVPLGQDPTHRNLLVGHQYSGPSSLGLVPLTKCVPNASLETRTGGGNGPLFYFYNIAASGADFAGNYSIATNMTCCVAGANYLIQESAGNGNILLSDQPAQIQSMAFDKNQNLYFISANALYELAFSAADGTYSTTPVPYGTAYSNPVGVSVDDEGNLYVADEGAAAIYEIPNERFFFGKSALKPARQFTVATGITSAVPVAVDRRGDLYYTTPNATAVDKLSRGKADFGTVALGHTATRTVNFQFNGPTTIEKILLPTGVFAAEPASSTSVRCTAHMTYGPSRANSSCSVTMAFTPARIGEQSSAIVLLDSKGESIVFAPLEGVGK